ncbi:hypothetical protein LguiA_025067 [Lonicera macranthoides]
MQSGQRYPPQTPVLPFADQVGAGYMHNNTPLTSLFGGTVLPSGANPFTPFHTVDIQPSDVCPRNFIIFDQTDNRSQIMFHPAAAPKFCYPGLSIGAPFLQDNAKRNGANEEREISSSLKEDSHDIDALLSLEEEEEEEEDEEEVSTARTYGNYGSDSPDSGPTRGPKHRKRTSSSSSPKSTGSGSSVSERKRMKMRKMVKTLRGIVPGGDRMNTVAVLDEAVRYLKSLKVEVQKLGVGNIKSEA